MIFLQNLFWKAYICLINRFQNNYEILWNAKRSFVFYMKTNLILFPQLDAPFTIIKQTVSLFSTQPLQSNSVESSFVFEILLGINVLYLWCLTWPTPTYLLNEDGFSFLIYLNMQNFLYLEKKMTWNMSHRL